MKQSNESSSDSEEDNEMLREALDSSMFTLQSASTALREPKQRLCHKDNILNVTPEFQKFVATRLSKLLDETIKECRREHHHFESDESNGIRLFSDSTRLLRDKKCYDPFCADCSRNERIKYKKSNKNKQINANKRSLIADNEDESCLLEKAHSAAVSVEWVFNKEGIKEWSKPKGEEIKYRRNEKNGALEIVNPPFKSVPR